MTQYAFLYWELSGHVFFTQSKIPNFSVVFLVQYHVYTVCNLLDS